MTTTTRDASSTHETLRPSTLSSIFHIKEDKRLSTNYFTLEEALSPDVKCPELSPLPLESVAEPVLPSVECIGSYFLWEKTSLSTATVVTRRAVHTGTREEFVCKILPLNRYREILAPYRQAGFHPNISNIVEILLGKTQAYVIFQRHCTDLHSYIREKRNIKEHEAAGLFSQIVGAVQHCHRRGIVLRDIKLRKFVFTDEQRTHLVLEGLEDARILEDTANDHMTEKHGCPAYASPEIIHNCSLSLGYSGKPADIWSLGVVLYTLLYGMYPFHASHASLLFSKIISGLYKLPEGLTAPARCLIQCMLRKEPSERLTIDDVCKHPWFTHARVRDCALASTHSTLPPSVNVSKSCVLAPRETDQTVPEIPRPSRKREFSLLE